MQKPRKPSRLLIGTVMKLCRSKFARNYNLHIDRSQIEQLKAPYIVIYNHVGSSDHFITGMTLYPVLANNMASGWVRHKRVEGILSKYAGCIYKDRFIPDIDCVLATKHVLRRGGVVALAPAASYSFDGTPNYFDFGVSKLVKMFKVPVVAIKMNGLYMWNNRFSTVKSGKCTISAVASVVLSPQEAESMSLIEIYKRLYVACDFNDFDWYEQHGTPIESADIYGKLDHLCYKCLKCGEEYSIQATKDGLTCKKCGNTVKLDELMRFVPSQPNSAYVKNLSVYHAIQRKLLLNEIQSDDFRITDDCSLYHYTSGKKYGCSKYGNGTLTLDRKGITYVGTDNNQQVQYFYPLNKVTNLGSATDQYISFDKHGQVDRYCLNNMKKATKLIVAYNLMRLKYYPDFPGQLEWINSLNTTPKDLTIYGKQAITLPTTT